MTSLSVVIIVCLQTPLFADFNRRSGIPTLPHNAALLVCAERPLCKGQWWMSRGCCPSPSPPPPPPPPATPPSAGSVLAPATSAIAALPAAASAAPPPGELQVGWVGRLPWLVGLSDGGERVRCAGACVPAAPSAGAERAGAGCAARQHNSPGPARPAKLPAPN